MRELWCAAYEEVWNETDENTTEEQIIAETERRVISRLADMVEARVLRDTGRLQ